MKVLSITPWYPHKKNSASGIFVRDLAVATSKYVKSFLVHIYLEKIWEKLLRWKNFRMTASLCTELV